METLYINSLLGFNEHHPERRYDEIFLCNVTDTNSIGWKTKRFGVTAYDSNGCTLTTGEVPYFVKYSEAGEALRRLQEHRNEYTLEY